MKETLKLTIFLLIILLFLSNYISYNFGCNTCYTKGHNDAMYDVNKIKK